MRRILDSSSSLGSDQPEDKPTGSGGRDDGQGSGEGFGGDHSGSNHGSPRKAGVVIRAYVEHVGLVGDTELTVNVKWPASTFSAQPCAKTAAPSTPPQDTQLVPGNGPLAGIGSLYGEAVVDPLSVNTPDHPSENKE
jgi:hypothetical protein